MNEVMEWTMQDKKTEPREEVSVDFEKMPSMIKELAHLLGRNEASALSSFDSFKLIMVNSKFRESIMDMESYLDNFDFGSALPLLEGIADELNISIWRTWQDDVWYEADQVNLYLL